MFRPFLFSDQAELSPDILAFLSEAPLHSTLIRYPQSPDGDLSSSNVRQTEATTGYSWNANRLFAYISAQSRALANYPDGILLCAADHGFSIRWCNERFRWWNEAIREREKKINEWNLRLRSSVPEEPVAQPEYSMGIPDTDGSSWITPTFSNLADGDGQEEGLPPLEDPYGPIPQKKFPSLQDERFLDFFPIRSAMEDRFSVQNMQNPQELIREVAQKAIREAVPQELIFETTVSRRFRMRIQPFRVNDEQDSLFLTLRDETSELNVDTIQKKGEILELGVDRLGIDYHDLDERKRKLRELVLSQTKELIEYQHFSLRILNPQTNELCLELDDGSERPARRKTLHRDIYGNGIAGVVAVTEQSYLCRDTTKDPNYLAGTEFCKSCIVVPMKRHGQLVGTINVESRLPDAFSESDVFALEIYARYLASALSTLELLSQQKEKTAESVLSDFHQAISLPTSEAEQLAFKSAQELQRLITRVEHGETIPAEHLQQVQEWVLHTCERLSDIRHQVLTIGNSLPAEDATPVDPALHQPYLFVAHRDVRLSDQILKYGTLWGWQVVRANSGPEILTLFRTIMSQHVRAVQAQFRKHPVSWRVSPEVDPDTMPKSNRTPTANLDYAEQFLPPDELELLKRLSRGTWRGPRFVVITGLRSTDGVGPDGSLPPKDRSLLAANQKADWLVSELRKTINELAPQFADGDKLTPCPDEEVPGKPFKCPVPVILVLEDMTYQQDHVQVDANREGASCSMSADLSVGVRVPICNIQLLRRRLNEALAKAPFSFDLETDIGTQDGP